MKNLTFSFFVFFLLGFLTSCSPTVETEEDVLAADVVVYGGTAAAVVAAVQVKRMGKSVIIVSPDRHLGGLSAGGLGWTDTGNKAVIGGLARHFYHKIYQHYQDSAAWKWQSNSDYGNRGQGTAAIDGAERTMWIFEPSAAETAFEDLIEDNEIALYRNEWLDREKGVEMVGTSIRKITTLSGKQFVAKQFIDATYEGDLMASAGVSYHVGREANSVYGEEWNGIQTGVLHHDHYFKKPTDPYREKGNPASGVLPRISTEAPGEYGEGDQRIQAYCFRMCLSNHPDNRVPFPKPETYDPAQYELLVRVFEEGWDELFRKFDPIPNRKTDTNNHGPFSTDNIGMNYDYPDASYEKRREIIAEHEQYQKGLMYFLANDPRIPKEYQDRLNEWGLAKDEFQDNGNWPHQLYIREARRMIGSYVMTEHEVMGKREVLESVGMGSYTMDSHNVQRYIKPDGHVQNEGDLGVKPKQPYQIHLGALLPKAEECTNLTVPICVSSSHIAFGSIRMEPVFMILGQSAATLAVQAIDEGVSVQAVPYEKLKEQLVTDGQILTYSKTVSASH
ncbi:MAG: FAD-dependent oxidoreductase [Saprospiraceae bacterium]|nr:FAD-dependent oxidoreductase [Saprospiraceae bacterium]